MKRLSFAAFFILPLLAACSGSGTTSSIVPISANPGQTASTATVSRQIPSNNSWLSVASAAAAQALAAGRGSSLPLGKGTDDGITLNPKSLTFVTDRPQTVTVTVKEATTVYAGSKDSGIASVAPAQQTVRDWRGGKLDFRVTPHTLDPRTTLICFITREWRFTCLEIRIGNATPEPTPTPTPVPTPTPTPVPTPTPTPVPTPTPTPVPTPTPTPVPTPTPTPVPTPTPTPVPTPTPTPVPTPTPTPVPTSSPIPTISLNPASPFSTSVSAQGDLIAFEANYSGSFSVTNCSTTTPGGSCFFNPAALSGCSGGEIETGPYDDVTIFPQGTNGDPNLQYQVVPGAVALTCTFTISDTNGHSALWVVHDNP